MTDAERLAAIAAFEDAMQRVDNQDPEIQRVAALGQMMTFMKRLMPERVRLGQFDLLWARGEDMLVSAEPVHEFGGGDAVPKKEILNIMLGSLAQAYERRSGVGKTKSWRVIAEWSGVSTNTVRRWSEGGKQITPTRLPDYKKALEKAEAALEPVPDDRVEEFVRDHVQVFVKGTYKTVPRKGIFSLNALIYKRLFDPVPRAIFIHIIGSRT